MRDVGELHRAEPLQQLDPVHRLHVDVAQDHVRHIEGDLAKARLVLTRDAEIDALNRRNYEELFGKAGDAAKVSASHVELIFISKALERIGDHSKNIAEQVIFLLSGEDVRHAR